MTAETACGALPSTCSHWAHSSNNLLTAPTKVCYNFNFALSITTCIHISVRIYTTQYLRYALYKQAQQRQQHVIYIFARGFVCSLCLLVLAFDTHFYLLQFLTMFYGCWFSTINSVTYCFHALLLLWFFLTAPVIITYYSSVCLTLCSFVRQPAVCFGCFGCFLFFFLLSRCAIVRQILQRYTHTHAHMLLHFFVPINVLYSQFMWQ